MNEFYWVLFDSLRTIISRGDIKVTQAKPNNYTNSYTVKSNRGQFVYLIRCESRFGREIFDIKVRDNWFPDFPREYAQEMFERTYDEYTRQQEIATWDKTQHDTIKFLNKISKRTK